MKLGLLARADNTGLGVQTHEFYKHMKPAKTMVVDISQLNGNENHFERYPDADIITKGFPKAAEIDSFLEGLDVVFSCETPYNYYLFQRARELGVKTVLQYNWEFLDYLQRPQLPKPDLFAAPSLWHFDDLPFDNKVYMPVPVNTDKLSFVRREKAHTFLHIAGKPAVNDRNGTQIVLDAMKHVKSDIKLVVRSQDRDFIADSVMPRIEGDERIAVNAANLPNYEDIYELGDVLLMPRKYGGLCLPVNEAIAKGMPVIMTDIDPNNKWLQEDWLIPATKTGEFMTRTMIDIYEPSPKDLAAKIDWFAQMGNMFAFHNLAAQTMRKGMGWDNLKPRYEKEFKKLCNL